MPFRATNAANWSSIIRIGAKMAVIRRRIARRPVSSHTQRAGRVPYGESRSRRPPASAPEPYLPRHRLALSGPTRPVCRYPRNHRPKFDHAAVRDRLARWFWCGIFGELYGSAIESRFAKDVLEVPAWLNGGPEPSTITEGRFRHTLIENQNVARSWRKMRVLSAIPHTACRNRAMRASADIASPSVMAARRSIETLFEMAKAGLQTLLGEFREVWREAFLHPILASWKTRAELGGIGAARFYPSRTAGGVDDRIVQEIECPLERSVSNLGLVIVSSR